MSRNVGLFVIVLGLMMTGIDTTAVILALPDITLDLHSNLDTTIWVIIIYLLIIAVMTTQLGRFGDSFGRSKIYNSGFVVFTVGSALAGTSFNIYELIGFRALQAFGGALMQANSGALIADLYPANERGRAYGYTSIGYTTGATLGILVGGIITTFIGWEYIFYINIPIGIIATILGIKNIKSGKTTKTYFDIPGLVSLLAALTLTTYGAANITGVGVDSFNIALIITGLIILGIFISVEKKVKNPIINMKVFIYRVFNFSLFASFFESMGYLSVIFIIMYLQGIRGLTPLDASLLLVPGYVIGACIAPFAGRLTDKIGARIPATSGLFLMLAGILVYTTFSITTPLYFVIIASILGGSGSSLFYPANNSAVMANAPPGYYGLSSGLLRTFANIGTLISYVLAITIASITVPKYVALEVFLGLHNIIGSLAAKFMTGIRSALIMSFIIVVVAMLLSLFRGKENRLVPMDKR
ncbi:MFS transporter [Ferroplasma sp.]|uniref:MFS transporter n=1 Tax=Ferroplasma sp. TaxID=2591003 RepID=UPI00261945FC|nr:MFS transporter [Ferroplasma sp.]